MADSKVPGLLDKLPTPPSRAEMNPAYGERPAKLRQATPPRQVLNVGGKRSPATGGE